MSETRNEGLKEMLGERRRELQEDVHSRMRNGRSDRPNEVRDDVDASDAHIQGDLEVALLQMRAETLSRVDTALARLDAGTYGSCADCKGEIAQRRLHALPFAVRCQACEERREQAQGRARQVAQRRDNLVLFPDLTKP